MYTQTVPLRSLINANGIDAMEFYNFYRKLIDGIPYKHNVYRDGQLIYHEINRQYPNFAQSITTTDYDMFFEDRNIYGLERELKNFLGMVTAFDFNGKEIQEGDRVICTRPYGYLEEQEVEKITKKSVIFKSGWYISIRKARTRIIIIKQ